MTYIYPKLSEHDYGFFRIGGGWTCKLFVCGCSRLGGGMQKRRAIHRAYMA